MRSRLFLLSCALLIGSAALLSLFFALDGRAAPVLAEPARLPEPAALQNTSPMTRYVALSGSDTTTCTRPLSPCRTIQHGIDVATAGDLIKVATGVYTDVHARDGYHQIAYITQTLTIRGGYTTSNWSNSNPISYPTTLDAHGAGRGIYIEPPEWPVVTRITPTIEGLRITGGYANGSGIGGGGIYAQQVSPTIRNNWIGGNDASSGGGISLWYCSGTVISNTITGNNAGDGGGVTISESDTQIIGNLIASNTAGYGGGLISIWAGAPLIRHNTITSNTAEIGGGLFTNWSEATLQGNLIAANVAQHGGGAWIDSSEVDLENTIIADNQAAEQGSGLLVSGSSIHLRHTTFARNGSARGYGTGVDVIVLPGDEIYSTVMLSNTILVSHTVGISVAEGCTARLDGTLWGSGAWSNKADWAGTVLTGTVNLWADPGFRDPERGDYRILPHSPAVDAGIFSDVRDDVDGDPRPAGFGWDIGADESPGASLGLSASASSSDLSPGETVTYTLAVTNVGLQTTTDVHLANTLPGLQQLTHVTISQGACLTSGTWGGEVGCDLGTLAPGDRRHITLTAEVTSTRPPLAQLPQWMRSTTWLTASETTNHAHIDTILQDCHVRLNDNPAEYAVVQAAIDASTHPTDVVKIAGACTLASSRGMLPYDLDSRIQIGYIDKALTLQGGWNISFTRRDVQAYPTTLYSHVDGRVLYVTDGADARIEGLRILGGRAGHRTSMGRCRGGGGVCVSRASVSIADSVIRGGEAVIGGGVSLYYESSGTLVNTVVADNRTTLAGAGVFISSDSSGTFYHTTVARNTGSDGVGVRVEGAAFLTNTIVASHTVGVHSSGNTILNATLWHGNGTDWAGDGTIDHANDVWGDPTFVDPGAGDYHITPHSAAVDQGVHTAIATDIDGQTRPMGLAPDLGADEIANSPSIRYVATSGSDTTMCTHPFSPCRTVQYAVDVAESGDEVLVAQGIYSGTNPVLGLSKTVTVCGGYTTTDWGVYDPISYRTTLDGRQQGRVVYVGAYVSPTIQGFHITGGNPGDNQAGGGVFVNGALSTGPILIDNTIYGNQAGYGGGVGLSSSFAVLRSNTIVSNSAEAGGGIDMTRGESVLVGNLIANNRADLGGGITSGLGDRSTFIDTAIVSNTARDFGGGLLTIGGYPTVVGSEIVSNSASYGGGATLMGCFENCLLVNTVIADNDASVAGDGVFVADGRSEITHCTIANNGGGDGSGVHVNTDGSDYATVISLTNTILVSHTVGITVAEGSTATLQGTLWGNETDWAGAGTIVTGTVNVSGNPDFVDPDGGNYHISVHSAAVDAGVDAGVVTDIDGEERPMGFGPDIGADEVWRRIYSFYLPILHR